MTYPPLIKMCHPNPTTHGHIIVLLLLIFSITCHCNPLTILPFPTKPATMATMTTVATTTATKTKDPSKKEIDAAMISARTRQASTALKQIEELRLTNKKKNNKARKQQEEDEKRRKDKAEEERQRTEAEAAQTTVAMTPQNLHDILNGVNQTQLDNMD
jgi:hypothetical protein